MSASPPRVLLLEPDDLHGAAGLLEHARLARDEHAVLRHLGRGDHVGDHEDAKRVTHLLRMPHVPVARLQRTPA